MNRPLHWVFDKGPVDNEHGPSHYFHGVISGANDLMDTPAAEIVAMALDELRRAFPQMMAGRELVHGNAVKEKRATFACVAGVDALRPPPGSTPGNSDADIQGISNLVLAGDWTATGWPATMEGATRSGYRAAQAALEAAGLTGEEAMPAERLPPRAVVRWLAG